MPAVRQPVHVHEPQRSEVPRDGKHPEQEASISDAVNDECLVCRVAGRLAMKVETDQQVGAQTHAFPSHKHQHVVVAQDEREHREHEQVQVSEEAVIPTLVRHVTGRINVDQHSHAGHKQQPYAGEWIEQETGVRLKRRQLAIVGYIIELAGIRSQPCVYDLLKRLPGSVSEFRVLPHRSARPDKRQHNRPDADRIDRRLLHLAAKKEHDRRANRGQQGYQPDVIEKYHLISSNQHSASIVQPRN